MDTPLQCNLFNVSVVCYSTETLTTGWVMLPSGSLSSTKSCGHLGSVAKVHDLHNPLDIYRCPYQYWSLGIEACFNGATLHLANIK